MKKSTILVFFLAIVLAAIYFLTRDKNVSVGIKKIELPAFDKELIDKIVIQDHAVTIITKKNNNWVVQLDNENSPMFKADGAVINNLINAVREIKNSHYVTSLKEKLADFELDESKKTVRLLADGSAVWELDIGRNASSDSKFVKKVDSNEVYAVSGSFWQILRSSNDLRDRRIFSLTENEVTEFKVTKLKSPVVSIVKESGEWQVDKSNSKLDKSFRVDSRSLTSMVNTGVKLRATGFIDIEPTLTDPILTVEAVAAKTEIVDFFMLKDKYLAKRRDYDQIYEISKYSFSRLNEILSNIRDMSIIKLDKDKVKSISVRSGKEIVTLAKEDDKWALVKPQNLPKDFEFDGSGVTDILSMLSNLKADRLANKSDRPREHNWQKSWTIELIDIEDQKIFIRTSQNLANKKEYLIKGNIDKEIYVISESKVKPFSKGLMQFQKSNFELPEIGENIQGFDSLPPDMQKKLLEMAKNN